MAEWEDGLREAGLIGPCYAVAIGQDDSQLFAAVAQDDVADPWSVLYADDYDIQVTQEDDSTATETINEWTTITSAFDPSSFAAFYLGGTKYTFCNRDEQDEVTVVLGKRSKGGAVIAKCSNGYYLVGLYDEEREQVVGPCVDSIVSYAKYLVESC